MSEQDRLKHRAAKDAGEAFDDLRLIVADVVKDLGIAVQHGDQALENDQEQGLLNETWDQWTQAHHALLRARDRIEDAIDNCVEAGAFIEEEAK